jgi:hypothetical protein
MLNALAQPKLGAKHRVFAQARSLSLVRATASATLPKSLSVPWVVPMRGAGRVLR